MSMSPEDQALLERFQSLRSLAADERRAESEAIVNEHAWLAERCARRFGRRGEPTDDLLQVASIGLIKAVERFDASHGVPFAAFATPTILGELRRYFRDSTWSLKVPRRAKDLHVRIPAATERLSQSLGRSPTPDELAAELDETVEHVLEGLEAGSSYRTISLDRPAPGASGPGMDVAAEDDDLLRNQQRLELARLLERLGERERRIVYLRFFEDLTQSEIAEIVGTSQVHVSRLLRGALRQMSRSATGDSLNPAG